MEKKEEVSFDAHMGGTQDTNEILWDEREEEKQGFASDVVIVQGNEGGFQSSEGTSGSTRILLNFQEIFAKCNPLGITLRKTSSLASLLEMQLSPPHQPVINNTAGRTRMDNLGSQPLAEKLKASNFPITSIKIGAWQRTSMNEGDLIAKLYYAKRKIVWEVLDGPLESTLEGEFKSILKSKIEIVWSDITGIQAIMEDDQPGILKIELDKPPMFFRETNPQAGKHTTWQIVNDFTNGQASTWRIHCVSFPSKVLDKHYEKLLQCDQQLFKLSQVPFPSHECPYFQSAMIMPNFNGFGSAFAPLYQQYRCPTNYLTVARGLPIRPPPNPVMDFPYINHERPGNNQLVAQSQHQPIWRNQEMNIFSRGNINSTQLGPSMFASQTPGSQLVFNGNNYYQPNGALTLDTIEKQLALEDSQADEANIQAQMHRSHGFING